MPARNDSCLLQFVSGILTVIFLLQQKKLFHFTSICRFFDICLKFFLTALIFFLSVLILLNVSQPAVG